MIVYLVRHGQTDWNATHRLQGLSNIPLNANGIETARMTGEKLAHISFTKAISSPLDRAYQTCQLILSSKTIPIETNSDLRELSFGDYEGLSIYGSHKNIPDDTFYDTFFHHPEHYKTPPNGESLRELRLRAKHFLETLQKKSEWEDETILITAHGAILCAILAEIHQYDMANFWGKGLLKNCSVTILNIQKSSIQIQVENEILWQD